MMNNTLEQDLRHYGRTILETGNNLQHGQILIINVDVESAAFAHIVAEEAYKLGAKEVVFNWRSTTANKLRLSHCSKETLGNPAPWIPEYYRHYVNEKASILSLISANPYALEGVPAEHIKLSSQAVGKITKFYHDAIMDSTLTWCVASVATLTWANLLKFEGSDEEKIDALWQRIFTLCRTKHVAPEEMLPAHLERLSERTKKLNELRIKTLHYTCPNGTDFTVDLPKGHIWLGGKEYSKEGILFDANIPTEEVFTAPQYDSANGIVYSTKPLIYQGNTIHNFHITFADGKVTKYYAETGEDFLRNLIETDEFSCYLGEIALVDHYSPISQSDTIYFETLFDENASCHLALGAAYPTCLSHSDGLSPEELRTRGLNSSLAHTDFMIGHEEMNITATTEEGTTVPIMVKGKLLL